MTETLVITYTGRVMTSADDYIIASGVATAVNPASLVEEKIVSWDNLSADVVAELMIWENASDQDLRHLDEFTG